MPAENDLILSSNNCDQFQMKCENNPIFISKQPLIRNEEKISIWNDAQILSFQITISPSRLILIKSHILQMQYLSSGDEERDGDGERSGWKWWISYNHSSQYLRSTDHKIKLSIIR